MPDQHEIFRKADNTNGLGFWRRAMKFNEGVDDFQHINGRKPNSDEAETIRRNVGLTRLLYIGTCPCCKSQSQFFNAPRKIASQLVTAVKQLGLLWLKPIDSLKQLLGAHKHALPCFCGSCDACIVVCPLCNTGCGRAPVDPGERVKCPGCGAIV